MSCRDALAEKRGLAVGGHAQSVKPLRRAVALKGRLADATASAPPSRRRWEQLGLPYGSSYTDLKARYRKLTALHPDRNPGNALAAQAFALVSAAYAELCTVVAHAAAPAPLHSSQPEAPAGNRWQAFTGQQQYKPAPAPAAAAAAQPPVGSQENRTPGSGWGQAARWGRQAVGVVRAQPLAPGNAAAGQGPGSAAKRKQQQQQPGVCERHGTQGLQEASSDSCSGDSSDSSGSDSGDERRSAPSGGGIRPVAFYSSGGGGSGGRRPVPSPHPAAPAAAPPVVSLYGTFGAQRSSGGYAVPSSWLRDGTSAAVAASQQQEQQQQQPARLWGPQRSSWPGGTHQAALQQGKPAQQTSPAAQGVELSQQQHQQAHGGAPPVSSRWGAKSRAEVLRVSTVPTALAAEAGAPCVPQKQPEQHQQEQCQPLKRQRLALGSSSGSSSGSEGGSEGGSSDDDEGERGAVWILLLHVDGHQKLLNWKHGSAHAANLAALPSMAHLQRSVRPRLQRSPASS